MNNDKITMGEKMIIGITGKSGSGKSYLSETIAKKIDAKHVDIDKVSHRVLSLPNTKLFLKQNFGEQVFENGEINRKKLGRIVFGDEEKLNLLNEFCQFQIEKYIDEILLETHGCVILDYALLPWLKHFKLCKIKVLLNADFETRYTRVSEREKISKDYFLSRDKSVKNYDKFQFDFVYDNISKQEADTLISTLETIANKEHI